MNKQEAKKMEKSVFDKKTTVIIGVSGGADSVFLLHLLKKTPAKIVIAHINHKLRGKDSDLDEKFVRAMGDIVEIKSVKVSALSKKSKKGLEETARQVRYDFFKKIADKYRTPYIITAHTADDNLETVILNLTRGGGLEGLSGIQKTSIVDNKYTLVRPIIEFAKSDILDYLKIHRIPFRTDKSNADLIFSRNFIRHKIIPELKKLNPNLIKTIAHNTKNLHEISNYLNENAEKWIKKNTLNVSLTAFNAKALRRLEIPLQKTIIRQIYKDLTKQTTNLETIHIDEILTLISNNVGNKSKKLGKLNVSLKNNIIRLKKN